MAQVIALPSLMGKADLWGWFLSLTALPAIFWLLTYTMTGRYTVFTAPYPFSFLKLIRSAESPRYTIIEKQDDSTGRKVLEKLRGTTNVSFLYRIRRN